MTKGSRILIDNYNRMHNYIRMALTERCNLRCQYCMPIEGVKLSHETDLLSLQERQRTLSLFSKLGMTKLRFTGGEPTISKQLVPIIKYANNLPLIKSIGITTNGITLASHIDSYIDAGLTNVNISLDTLNPDKFAEITRREKAGFSKVLSSIYAAIGKKQLGSTLQSVKINCVLIRNFNDNEIADFVNFTKEFDVDVRFIEMMPFHGNQWDKKKLITYMECISVLKDKDINLQLVTANRDENDTTKWYKVPGYAGRVGFITSMSNHFCSGCNRLRITGDGKLKVCLFGEEGLSLRDLYRSNISDEEIANHISISVKKKKFSLGGSNADELVNNHNRPMILIGG